MTGIVVPRPHPSTPEETATGAMDVMTVQCPVPAQSRYVLLSLKRGYARQAMARAARAQANHEAIFSELSRLAPNRRGMERTILRLRRMPGVICAGVAKESILVFFRNVCSMVTRVDGVDVFTEDAMIYSRVAALPAKGKVSFRISRASFSCHAIERFIERGLRVLSTDVAGAVDTEAVVALKRVIRGDVIVHEGDEYVPAREEGVWAGSLDATPPEASWGISRQDACIPTFSVRTFLGPDQMKPCVWLRWQDDPRLSLAS